MSDYRFLVGRNAIVCWVLSSGFIRLGMYVFQKNMSASSEFLGIKWFVMTNDEIFTHK